MLNKFQHLHTSVTSPGFFNTDGWGKEPGQKKCVGPYHTQKFSFSGFYKKQLQEKGPTRKKCHRLPHPWSWPSVSASYSHDLHVSCHSNETRAPIANLPNTAQLGVPTYHSPKLHLGPCSSVGMQRGTHTVIQTHRWPWPQYILLGYVYVVIKQVTEGWHTIQEAQLSLRDCASTQSVEIW